MRVALFTETFLPKIDGIVTVACLLLDHLAKRGIESVIVAPKMGEISHYAKTKVILVPGVTLPIYPELKAGPPTLSTYRQLQAFKPDIAHIMHPVIIGTAALMMGKWLGIPRLASFHIDMAEMSRHHNLSIMTPPMNLFARLTFNAADYTLAPSRQVREHMHSLG
ncbi:MAG TPA: glycosyltransferase, partial [Phototrophicaceae bacterium]|nr:glycosyltransferase [Phototrophicaceae bacterium]